MVGGGEQRVKRSEQEGMRDAWGDLACVLWRGTREDNMSRSREGWVMKSLEVLPRGFRVYSAGNRKPFFP